MPDYSAALPQLQNPDILGSYLRGREIPIQQQLQQQQIQAGQQEQEQRGLQVEQLRQMLGVQGYYFDKAKRESAGGQAGATQTGYNSQGSDPQGAPDDPWGPGQILGQNIPKSALSNQALGDISVAMGKEDPISAHLKATQADQADIANRKELAATQMLDPKSGSGIPFGIQLANMPSGNAEALMNNPAFMKQWPQHARSAGVDPADIFAVNKDGTPDMAKRDYAVKRVAYATVQPSLQAVGKEGLVKPPEHFTSQMNQYGEPVQVSDTTGESKAAPGYTAPGYSMVDVVNPDGTTFKRRVQTSGSFGGGGGPSGGGGSRSAAPAAPGAVNQPGDIATGMAAPTVDNQKAAKFASMFQTGVSKMRALEQGGYDFSPKARGVILDAATNEGGLDRFIPGSAIFKQWLIKNQLSAKDQEYMAALMPALQAAGHSLGGARLTTSQIRSLYESILPVAGSSQGARDQVNANRDSMYKGLLSESGSAAYTPEFRDTLGKDRQAFSGQKPSGAPKPGDVVKGYKFIGGDPAKQSSWQKQ